MRELHATGSADGLIEVRDANVLSLAERNQARKLVAEENSDRAALYTEVARANGHPEWETEIRQAFAKVWVANARSGWYYKSEAGAWQQK